MPSVTLPEVEIIGYWPSYNPPAGLDNVMGPGAGGTSSGSQSSDADTKDSFGDALGIDP